MAWPLGSTLKINLLYQEQKTRILGRQSQSRSHLYDIESFQRHHNSHIVLLRSQVKRCP